MMNTQLNCPNCKSSIAANDINISQLIAKCANCGQVFNFSQGSVSLGRQRPEIVIPPGIEAYSLLSELNFEISWRRSSSSFLTFFTILWNLFLIPFVGVAIFSGEFFILAFISLHLLVGVSLLYYTIATFVNTTYVMVDRHRVTIEHKPMRMPFYPNRDIPVREIKQLYTKRYVAGTTNNKPNHAFQLCLKKTNGVEVVLIKGLKNPDHARYVEQEVERFLDIDDLPVKGEWLASS
jgi:predicted Zn finger-like uncharacterized protein